MRALALLAVAFCLVVAYPTSAKPTETTILFDAPAQARGDVVVSDLTWALFVFHDSEASFDVEATGGTVTNRTYARPHVRESVSGSHVTHEWQAAESTKALSAPVSFGLGFGERWSSLYIAAEEIRLDMADSKLEVQRSHGDELQAHYLPRSPAPLGTYELRERLALDGVALTHEAPTPTTPSRFLLTASGVRWMQWHNATATCAAGSCPDGARAYGERWNAGDGAAGLMAMPYVELEAAAAQLTGVGTVAALAAGGAALNVELAGSLRMPRGFLDGACKDECGSGVQTLLLEGQTRLGGLTGHPGGRDRLHASLAGRFDGVRFDETPVRSLLPVSAVAAGATAGVALLAKAVAALFARRPNGWQDHPRTRALLDLIRGEPGLSFQGLKRKTGWATGTLHYHLRRLLSAGATVGQTYLNTVRYFENHGRYDAMWSQVVQLRDPDLRRLHQWIQANPDQTQRRLLEATSGWDWSRARTQRRLKALEASGLLAVHREGRSNVYAARAPKSVPGPEGSPDLAEAKPEEREAGWGDGAPVGRP